MNKTVQIILVRLCECDGTIAKRWGKHGDLTEHGSRQARAIRLRFRGFRIKAWLSSSCTACRQTADILAGGQPVNISSEFSHPPYPQWNGLTLNEIEKGWPREYQDFWNPQAGDAQRIIVPGGESFQKTFDRLKHGLDHIYQEYADGESVGIVTHGEVFRLLTIGLLGAPLENISRLRGRNGGITIFSFDGKTACFECVNDTTHLEEPSQDFVEIALKL